MVQEVRGTGLLSGIAFTPPGWLKLRVAFEAFRKIHPGLFGQVLQLPLDNALREFPDLARRLQSSAVISTERGAVTASRKLKAVYRDHIALIGDASGSVDAITGQGLCLVFRQATALAEAIERGDLAQYQRKHRQIARRAEWMAKLLLLLSHRPQVRRAAIGAMAPTRKFSRNC